LRAAGGKAWRLNSRLVNIVQLLFRVANGSARMNHVDMKMFGPDLPYIVLEEESHGGRHEEEKKKNEERVIAISESANSQTALVGGEFASGVEEEKEEKKEEQLVRVNTAARQQSLWEASPQDIQHSFRNPETAEKCRKCTLLFETSARLLLVAALAIYCLIKMVEIFYSTGELSFSFYRYEDGRAVGCAVIPPPDEFVGNSTQLTGDDNPNT